jgi:hypothetical protein
MSSDSCVVVFVGCAYRWHKGERIYCCIPVQYHEGARLQCGLLFQVILTRHQQCQLTQLLLRNFVVPL